MRLLPAAPPWLGAAAGAQPINRRPGEGGGGGVSEIEAFCSVLSAISALYASSHKQARRRIWRCDVRPQLEAQYTATTIGEDENTIHDQDRHHTNSASGATARTCR
jgi:hypothetical protein